jgi:hypothetical protein
MDPANTSPFPPPQLTVRSIVAGVLVVAIALGGWEWRRRRLATQDRITSVEREIEANQLATQEVDAMYHAKKDGFLTPRGLRELERHRNLLRQEEHALREKLARLQGENR